MAWGTANQIFTDFAQPTYHTFRGRRRHDARVRESQCLRQELHEAVVWLVQSEVRTALMQNGYVLVPVRGDQDSTRAKAERMVAAAASVDQHFDDCHDLGFSVHNPGRAAQLVSGAGESLKHHLHFQSGVAKHDEMHTDKRLAELRGKRGGKEKLQPVVTCSGSAEDCRGTSYGTKSSVPPAGHTVYKHVAVSLRQQSESEEETSGSQSFEEGVTRVTPTDAFDDIDSLEGLQVSKVGPVVWETVCPGGGPSCSAFSPLFDAGPSGMDTGQHDPLGVASSSSISL